MNQEIFIRNSKWQNGACAAFFALMAAYIVYNLLTEKLAVYEYLIEGLFLILFIQGVIYFAKLMRDQISKITVSEQGIRIHPTVLHREISTAEIFLPWNDIRQAEMTSFAISTLKLHTRTGECLKLDLFGLSASRIRTFCHQAEALRQAAPEQRAELIARFQAA